MPIAWFLALKFLREYRAQSTFTLLAVGVGVAVMVFLSALINGLQQSLIERTLGTQAHVVVRPREERARPTRGEASPRERTLRRIERPAQRILSIAEWQRVDAEVQGDPGVRATSPGVLGEAFALRGSASRPVVLLGVDPTRFDRVIPVRRKLLRGGPVLQGSTALIGLELADDLGVDVGDKLRVQTPAGADALVSVGGIFDLGNREVNRRWMLLPMRLGQTLLDLPGGANVVHVKVYEIFEAERIASRIASRTGQIAESWMETNAQLLIGLRSQSSSSYTIQAFVFLAVAMGIASVLAVSVVQRTREIGILQAMGVGGRRIATIFVIQGALVGFLGSLLGCAGGAALSLAFARMAENPDGSATFPMDLGFDLFALATTLATAVGIASAALPARKAARLDPVEAIRHA